MEVSWATFVVSSVLAAQKLPEELHVVKARRNEAELAVGHG